MSERAALAGGNEAIYLKEVAAASTHDEIVASINRTGFYNPHLAIIPLVDPEVMRAGDRRVVATTPADSVRHVSIVGHDAIKFDDEPAIVLPSYRLSELLGLMIVERAAVRPAHYIERGFLKEFPPSDVRNSAMSRALAGLTTIAVDSNGVSLVKRSGSAKGATAGIVDATFTDLRQTSDYKQERTRSALKLFNDYLKKGGQQPALFDTPTVRAARTALQGFAGSGMTTEQLTRFRPLSELCASVISHRTDEYNDKHQLNYRDEYARVSTASTFSPDWQTRSACDAHTSVVFFPPGTFERKDEKLSREARAKEVCRGCPVLVECLESALDRHEPFGVWGGLNEAERKGLASRRG